MTRVLRILAALLLLAALLGAEGSGCGRRGGVSSDRPPNERQADPKATRIVFITARSSGPYTVIVTAREVGKTGTDQTGPLPIAGGEYKQELTYTSGLRIEIKVVVYGNPADQMRCSIADGPKVDSHQQLKEAGCLLTTHR